MADDYVDYSCSTNIERLARDVETYLRQWHLSDSDRHASSSDKQSSLKAIRHAIIPWNVQKETFEVHLNLWDGNECNEKNDLPLSLQQNSSFEAQTTLWSDLSLLLGIGQHLTLSCADIDTQTLQTALNISVSNCHALIPAFGILKYRKGITKVNSPLCGHLLGINLEAHFQITQRKKKTHWMACARALQRDSQEVINMETAQLVYQWNQPPMQSRTSLLLEGGAAPLYKDLFHGWRGPSYPHLQQIIKGWQKKQNEQVWGPPNDPLLQITGVAFLNQVQHFRIPFSHSTSTEDELEAAETMQEATLQPNHAKDFKVAVTWDEPRESLAATMRCVLAALIRTATLPRETLLAHIRNEDLMQAWDGAAGNVVASSLGRQANVSSLTLALVAAMDWSSTQILDMDEASRVVDTVMDASNAKEITANFPHTAVPGGLLSLLCLHLARLRSPCHMALVWHLFCLRLRRHWELREPLPNMNVTSLDAPLPPHAALVNAVSPNPDPSHCLIGQKLLVFGVCLEAIVAQELRQMENLNDTAIGTDDDDVDNSWAFEDDDDMETSEHSDSRMVSFAQEPLGESLSGTRTLFHGSIVDGLPQIDGNRPKVYDDLSTVLTAQFFDAQDGLEPTRGGARCPIPGSTLLETGDQVYAPYLSRPFPVTDDIVAQRRYMLHQQKESGKASYTVARRLEVAHLLQKPKLLADMRAFMAANPGAIFADFVAWYGNPSDPLEEYDDDNHRSISSTQDSVANKLDKAAEGIRVLQVTRDFWASTWQEATPLPAALQDPQFDASMTAEMALDLMETLHPASLLCQVMAVNMSTAVYTVQESAGPAIEMPSVQAAMDYLKSKIETACKSLSDDVVASIESISAENAKELPSSVVSVKSLLACEMACVALEESEIVISRAVSLLHKFPQEPDLVEKLLCNPPGTYHSCSESGRDGLFDVIGQQQERATRKSLDGPPQPSFVDLVFRNTDDQSPSQLCARLEDEQVTIATKKIKRNA